MFSCHRLIATAITACLLAVLPVNAAERIKDLASIAGVRDNQLVGYGLVVGLDGSGDQTTQTPFTVQSIINMLGNMGVTLPPGTNLQLKNVAAVMVTATLPPFARPGQALDITVSSMGNAKSLRGGTLVMTSLTGADGQIYAVAQGSVNVSGFSAEGQAETVTQGVPTSGRVPNGAIVERNVPAKFSDDTFDVCLPRSHLRRLLIDEQPNGLRSGKGDERGLLVPDQCGADLLADSRQIVGHPRR